MCKTNLENNLPPISRPSRRRDQEREPGQGEQRSKSVQNQRPPTRPGPRPESGTGSGRGLGRPALPPPRSGPPPLAAQDARHLHTLVHTHTRSATCSHLGWGLHRWHPAPGSAQVRASRRSRGVGSPPCGQAQETPTPTPCYLNLGAQTRPETEGRKWTVPGDRVGSPRWQRLLLPSPEAASSRQGAPMMGALKQLWQPPTAGLMERSSRHQVAPVVARPPLVDRPQCLRPATAAPKCYWLLRTPLNSASAPLPHPSPGFVPTSQALQASFWGPIACTSSVAFD